MNNDLKWLKMYEYAKNYYKEYGHLNVPTHFNTNDGINYDKDGIIRLGSWISAQRYLYNAGKLSQERIELLNKIDMCFDKKKKRIGWNKMYEYVKKYYEEYGNLDIPYNFKTKDGINYDEDGYDLVTWIRNQRAIYNANNLSQERTELLELIDMVWQGDKNITKWYRNYEYSKKYYEEYGNLEVPYHFKTNDGINYDEDGVKLGIWINTQRKLYKNNNLSSDRQELLEVIGMRFDNKRIITNKSWEEMYKYAKEYYEEYGNLEVPQSFKTNDGINLGTWINTQRQYYKNNKLSQEKIDLLEEINMVWGFNVTNWKEIYEYAKIYYEEYGNLKVPKKFRTNDGINYDKDGTINLGVWVNTQRYFYNINNLSSERIELLESIGMIWNKYATNDEAWNKMYEYAKNYYEEYGNLKIPYNFKTNDEFNLGNWINKQRQYYKNNKLSIERQELLESIGMIWNIRGSYSKTKKKKKNYEGDN